MSRSVETFRLSFEQAESYEENFVPAIFAKWAHDLVTDAAPAPGDAVLDVACGTGIVARHAAERLGAAGSVVGLDVNEAMLTVARRVRPDLEWRQGDAAELPFEDESFDVVLCQAALIFFPNRVGALQEMARVARPGGTVGVHVPGRLESSAPYARFIEVVVRHAGPEAKSLLDTYFVLGDLDEVAALVASAGLEVTATRTRLTMVAFGSIDQFVSTEIESTPLIERLSEETYRAIREDCHEALAPFVTEQGAEGPIEGHTIISRLR